MKPSLGRIVITKGIATSNGTDECAAIITRVWSDKDPADGAPAGINVTAFPDLMTAQHQGSVDLYETRAEAEAYQARVMAIETNAANYRKLGKSGPIVAFWPDRV